MQKVNRNQPKIFSSVNEFKGQRKEVNQAKLDLLEQLEKLQKEQDAHNKEQFQHFASLGKIAIDRQTAHAFTHSVGEFTPDDMDILEQYIQACDVYAQMQTVFSQFYKSPAYSKICEMYATGMQPHYVKTPRLVERKDYPHKWIGFSYDVVIGSLARAKSILSR